MPNFYITFGQLYRQEQHPSFPKAHPDGWVRIEAGDEGKARAIAFSHFGELFATSYTEEDFDISYFPMGEIAVLKEKKRKPTKPGAKR